MFKIDYILSNILKFFLFAATLTPLVVTTKVFFPFVFGKAVFFRSIIEIALILFFIYLIYNLFSKNNNLKFITENLKLIAKNPLFIAILLFFVSLIISVIFAIHPYRAFWGDIERGEGFFGLLHYLIFLAIALFIFEKKDLLRFFKISLIVGLILIFYGVLEYFGVKFPFSLGGPNPRPGSFVGNPAFLATHMFFIMAFSLIIFFENKLEIISESKFDHRLISQKFWKYFSLIMVVLAVLTIFMTATRGAILGLGAGIVSFFVFSLFQKQSSILNIFKFSISFKKISLAILALMVVFLGIFLTTKENVLWQSVPGFNRLAQINTGDSSTKMRLLSWQLSIESFKEKPIIGWGLENYLTAYLKYYDPDMALIGETWLDRSHNKIIDILVMQGIFGLLTYLGIFGALFYLLLKKKSLLMILLISILVAYFVQNLVLFDQPVSYLTFFALLGFVIYDSFSKNDENKNKEETKKTILFFKIILSILILTGIAVSGYSLYAYNYIPFKQSMAYKQSTKLTQVDLVVDKLKEAMYPYNFAQYNIRGTGLDTIYLGQYFYKPEIVGNPKFNALGKFLLETIDELYQKDPYDIRVQIREMEMLNEVAKITDAETSNLFYRKSELLMRDAIERSPGRQEPYYQLAFSLVGQNRYDEALEIVQKAVNLSSNVARARFHKAVVLAIRGQNQEALEELAVVEKLNPTFDTLMGEDMNSILLIYSSLRIYDKASELAIKSLKKEILHIFKKQYYEGALGYYIEKENKENFLLIADYLLQFGDTNKDEMEVLIDLVKKEKWDIIKKL